MHQTPGMSSRTSPLGAAARQGAGAGVSFGPKVAKAVRKLRVDVGRQQAKEVAPLTHRAAARRGPLAARRVRAGAARVALAIELMADMLSSGKLRVAA